jgi:hypothetical protein
MACDSNAWCAESTLRGMKCRKAALHGMQARPAATKALRREHMPAVQRGDW